MAAEKSQADAELEREIREGRKFTLAEAIGRMAGPGSMKGASPVARKQQAEAEIEIWLSRHLNDSSGALTAVLLRRVKCSELLLDDYDHPMSVLAGYCQQVLESEYVLNEVIREADAEWGKIVGERPHFDKAGVPPHPEDVYTVESVRRLLAQIINELSQCNRGVGESR